MAPVLFPGEVTDKTRAVRLYLVPPKLQAPWSSSPAFRTWLHTWKRKSFAVVLQVVIIVHELLVLTCHLIPYHPAEGKQENGGDTDRMAKWHAFQHCRNLSTTHLALPK